MGGLKKMFSPKLPKAPDPIRMPTGDKTEEIEAERKKLMARSKSGGRESTRLSGGDYGGTILGS